MDKGHVEEDGGPVEALPRSSEEIQALSVAGEGLIPAAGFGMVVCHQTEELCLAGQVPHLFELLYLREALIDIERSITASLFQQVDIGLHLRRRLPVA